ncbi:Dual specificity phosphatase, catalytic domain [Rhizoctonia solani]|uniref:Dual specificity phosphatase, catalytic domain n=1 Tax=Rhizoctonia solani TaxID=456999 RepID=A0A8H8T3B8_9AGAM|nr:Dual specificity phosphatase, catalytic domain [Rhizoctonia solani]QRW26443.1 Dual specificity phosphatase, catalytic domain [Rhizoctonia solani]
MPHLRLASEIEFPDGLLDGQMRDEWQSLMALGSNVRQNLRLRPLSSGGDEVECERPSFLSPTMPTTTTTNGIAAVLGPQGIDLTAVLGMRDALVIDTRPPEAYAEAHVPGSINMFFLSLKLKRLLKPGGLSDMTGLKPYIASEAGRATWDERIEHWDHAVVVLDNDMDPKNTGSQLVSLIQHLPDLCKRPSARPNFRIALAIPRCPLLVKKASRPDLSGRIELLTNSPDSATLPELDPTPPPPHDGSTSTSSSGYLSPPAPARSPSLNDLSPSPSPSSTAFTAAAPCQSPKTHSARHQIDTSTPIEPPPKLSLHTTAGLASPKPPLSPFAHSTSARPHPRHSSPLPPARPTFPGLLPLAQRYLLLQAPFAPRPPLIPRMNLKLALFSWVHFPHAFCTYLLPDDARLHSSPTYVHCKAGKSRSVTMVMAYLFMRTIGHSGGRMHSLWAPNPSAPTLPPDHNMDGTTSTASVSGVPGTAKPANGNFAQMVGAVRKGGQVRESLPPTFTMPVSDLETGEQTEIRDAKVGIGTLDANPPFSPVAA